jgi:hypothetical protein
MHYRSVFLPWPVSWSAGRGRATGASVQMKKTEEEKLKASLVCCDS